ncbi:MAG: VTT domain-containing protein, partial [Chloroflexota bacterium]|nr:VTT domain-containing protein [Chloroflexota bacterium]
FIALSFALAYLVQNAAAKFNFPLYGFAWVAYLVVFVTALVSNLTIIAPVPFAVSVMVAAATKWNPLIIALLGAAGGTLGELSGYYAGYLGRKIAISESVVGYRWIEGWVQRYGVWAILLLAFQPVIPFDVGGLVAGAAKMPLHKFLPALFGGKFPKYILLTYAGIGLIHYIPFFTP